MSSELFDENIKNEKCELEGESLKLSSDNSSIKYAKLDQFTPSKSQIVRMRRRLKRKFQREMHEKQSFNKNLSQTIDFSSKTRKISHAFKSSNFTNSDKNPAKNQVINKPSYKSNILKNIQNGLLFKLNTLKKRGKLNDFLLMFTKYSQDYDLE
jgi:hypothetical protein